jgi:hypothetical protein
MTWHRPDGVDRAPLTRIPAPRSPCRIFIVSFFGQNGEVQEESTMISGGNATVFVSNMDAFVRFYTEVPGLRLTNRFGNSWATVDAGKGLTIGLHPASPKYPAPGTKGGIMPGLEID